MSDGANKTATDEVLASIMRIVQSEKQLGAVADDGSGDDFSESSGDDFSESSGDGNSPLTLTPDMRLAGMDDDAVAQFVTVPAGTPLPPVDTTQTADPPPPTADDDLMRETIRAVVREELESGRGEALVRKIIRDEMTTGQTGGNLSRNVLRLIRSELEKAART